MITVEEVSIEPSPADVDLFERHPCMRALLREPGEDEKEILHAEDGTTLPARLVLVLRLLDGRLIRLGLPDVLQPPELARLAAVIRRRFAQPN